ncbi:MAG: hypothetical protein JOY80_05610 [Candidatus Dormibacteraeota bacterium]|nr:hypothetical protein [Candidatus Dormibacteraeota bacterium]
MSRKSKKRARAKFRPPVKASAPAGIGPGSAPPTRTLSQARVGGDQAIVRAVEMSLGANNRILKGPRGRMVVQSTDPSIPLDRVPYFTTDLIRLLVVAMAMVVLLAIGAFTVPQLIK